MLPNRSLNSFFGKRVRTAVSAVPDLDLSRIGSNTLAANVDTLLEPPTKVRRIGIGKDKKTNIIAELLTVLASIDEDLQNKLVRRILDPILDPILENRQVTEDFGNIYFDKAVVSFKFLIANSADSIPDGHITIFMSGLDIVDSSPTDLIKALCSVLEENQFTSCQYDLVTGILQFTMSVELFFKILFTTPSVSVPIFEKIITNSFAATHYDKQVISSVIQSLRQFLYGFYVKYSESYLEKCAATKDLVTLLKTFLENVYSQKAINHTIQKLNNDIAEMIAQYPKLKNYREHAQPRTLSDAQVFSQIPQSCSALIGIKDFLEKTVQWTPEQITEFVGNIRYAVEPNMNQVLMKQDAIEEVVKGLKDDLLQNPSQSIEAAYIVFTDLQTAIQLSQLSLAPSQPVAVQKPQLDDSSQVVNVIPIATINELLMQRIRDDKVTPQDLQSFVQQINLFRSAKGFLNEQEREEVISEFVKLLKQNNPMSLLEFEQMFSELQTARVEYKRKEHPQYSTLTSSTSTVFIQPKSEVEPLVRADDMQTSL